MFAISIIMVSCKQLQELSNLAKCEFKLKTIENIELAGVKVQNLSNISQINILDIAKLTTAYMSKNIPLSFNLNVDAKNPNPGTASITQLDWILQIDDIDMTRGILNQKYSIAPNGGVATIPMNMNFNLFDVLSGKSKDAIINFGLNLAGAGNTPTRVALKTRPTINVGNFPLQYPGYITVKNTFTSN